MLVVAGDDFAGDHGAHRIGWWTLTSFVPSGKVASTCTSWIISGTPAITWSRVTTCAPASIRSATLRPSRAPSRTRSEEHTSELQSLMRISYAVFCLKTKNISSKTNTYNRHYALYHYTSPTSL